MAYISALAEICHVITLLFLVHRRTPVFTTCKQKSVQLLTTHAIKARPRPKMLKGSRSKANRQTNKTIKVLRLILLKFYFNNT